MKEGLPRASEDKEVVQGLNRLTLRIERACGLRIEYFDGETPFPLRDSGMFDSEPIDHEGWRSWSSDMWSHVSAPGRYRITFKSPPGFQPVPPQEVTIPTGEMITVRVELERNL